MGGEQKSFLRMGRFGTIEKVTYSQLDGVPNLKEEGKA